MEVLKIDPSEIIITDMGDVVISKRLSNLINKKVEQAESDIDEMRRQKSRNTSRLDIVKK